MLNWERCIFVDCFGYNDRLIVGCTGFLSDFLSSIVSFMPIQSSFVNALHFTLMFMCAVYLIFYLFY